MKKNFSFILRQVIKNALQNCVFPFIYKWYARKPVDPRSIVFADAHKDELPYSMREIYRALKNTDYDIKECFCNYQTHSLFETFNAVITFMKLYAAAKYVFICDNFLPVASCDKRPETEVIQLWHAGGILKKYAYDTPDDILGFYKSNVFKNYTLLTVSAECCIPVYNRAMKQPEGVVRALGLSRTDIFFRKSYIDECRRMFKTLYPDSDNKKIAVWAPTFRGKSSAPEITGEEYVKKMEKELGDEWIVITKFHPHIENKMEERACKMSTEQLLPVADVLITDYSSVIFDAVLVDLPMVLYVPDREEFEETRGLYISLEEIPGKIVQNGDMLAENVIEIYKTSDKLRIAEFRDKYMKMCDGNATERILNYLDIKE
ncbi:MAG: CDP-glycerol glycerophosphotransferase family protein [Clostridium sp.]|nr:CDP-glycerol glycerophosphotransferase family protein [Clostridium sp.]MCM1547039.1 CDP-glycerol glycerophosphotransferase family protein [Ruminococcus sp.]